jgi:hypothetical protein
MCRTRCARYNDGWNESSMYIMKKEAQGFMLILKESVVSGAVIYHFRFHILLYPAPSRSSRLRRFPSSRSLAVALRNFFFRPNPRSRMLRSLFRDGLIRRRFPRTHFASAEIKDIYWSAATSGIRDPTTVTGKKVGITTSLHRSPGIFVPWK